MKRIAALVLLLGLICPTILCSQGETSNWYFGNGAGISFNDDGSVTSQTNGQLDTYEGCATISDSFGDLLFYTDGITVFNQDHTVMQNGRNLFGDSSSTQSALIIPKPGHPDIYFIFTVDTKAFDGDPDRGLNYTIVDMSLNNRLGAVTQKNISLLTDCSEKITAVVKDCSDESIWIMTLASADGKSFIFDTYHAFEISTNGVRKQSVRSTFSGLDIEDPRGYLKVAPDGTTLASANMQSGLFIYDFDARTGLVSNQEKITINGSSSAPYGLEFSPNSQFLYIHTSNDTFEANGNTGYLLQYDMLAPKVSASAAIIDNRNIFRGALQLGPNGQIYRTAAKSYFEGSPFLSVIKQPNRKGSACNYMHDAISLNGKNATQGLPPFIQSFFNKVGILINQDGTTSSSLEICERESFTLEAEIIDGGIYTWEKDGIILSTTKNVLEVPSAVKKDSGKYVLTITTADPIDCPIIGEALIKVSAVPEANILVLEQCDVDSNTTDGITLVNLEEAIKNEDFEYTFYRSEQDQSNNMAIENPARYSNTQAFSETIYYSVINELGCEDTGELTLVISAGVVALNPDSPILTCDINPEDGILEGFFDLEAFGSNQYSNLDVTFYNNLDDVAIEENPLDGNIIGSNTTIYARIENENQCIKVEIIELEVLPQPELNLEQMYQVCTDGEPLQIEVPIAFDNYTWYNENEQEISNTHQISISDPGNYSLKVGLNYQNGDQTITCTKSASFKVTPSNRAVFDEITITDFSEKNAINIMVSGDGNYEFSLDGIIFQNEPLFEDISPGFYTIFSRDRNGCGISEEETVVVGFPKVFTPNGDGTNDTWQLIGADSNLIQGNVTIYNRYGKLIKQIAVTDSGWDGTFDGAPLPASDYWFKVNVEGRKQFRGHFALKR